MVHYLTMSILKEQALNGHHNVVILPFLGMKKKGEKNVQKN